MSVAYVLQPWAEIRPPSESVSIWVDEVSRRLANRGTSVSVYGPKLQDVDGLSDGGVEYRFVDTAWDWRIKRLLEPAMRRFGRPLFASRAYFRSYGRSISARLSDEPVDFVHVHNFSHFIPILRRALPKARLVLHMHCDWLSTLPAETVRDRISTTDAIVGCSHFITEEIRGAFPELADRLVTVFNGVDTQHFSPALDEGARTSPGAHLLFVGRLSPEKGLHTLIEAFRLVLETYPATKLTLVGPVAPVPFEMLVGLARDPLVASLARYYPDNYRSRLEKLAGPAGQQITWAGAVPHAATRDYYREATVLVNPSVSEAFGMSLVEAMACGVPIVATRTGGIRDLVQEETTGLLVAPENAEELATAIERLLDDEGLRSSMGTAGRKWAEANTSWEVIEQQVADLYRRLGGYHPVSGA